MKQSLQLKVSQYLALTPQLQQSIKLLQLSTLDLNQDIEQFLLENPLLEREEADPGYVPELGTAPVGEAPAEAPSNEQESYSEPASGAGENDWPLDLSVGGSREGRDDEENDFVRQDAANVTLREHLSLQMRLTNLSERDRSLTSVLIEALDEDGYLTQSIEELAELLPAELEVDADELAIALRHVQNFDPIGVGARTVCECLALQLRALEPKTPGLELALTLVETHLEALAGRDFTRLKRALGCSDEELRTAQQLIRKLNPKPGASFTQAETRYVVPDVVVKKVKNVWLASLNRDALPRLRINRMYADILHGQRGANPQLSSQLQEARWLIKNVQQRFDTILRVSQAIVDRQRNFFEHGEVAMRPLILHEIAETLGLHESTVSRATSQKFMATPRGIFELKYFFGSHVATDTGGACSSTAIRALIKQLVGGEDTNTPLSDSKISEILGKQGIMVARRTVAKYRESMHIPPVNQRKSI